MTEKTFSAQLELPLKLHKGLLWPHDSTCPVCAKKFDGAFAVFNGGALMGNGDGSASMDKRLRGFLNLTWHGAHHHPDPKDNDVQAHVDVVDDTCDGQFDLYFCSPGCLRTFLNACVDKLETDVALARDAEKQSAEKQTKE